MKFYNLDTKYSFGKYVGKTLREIIEIQPSYIDWCAINLEHFYIDEDVIDEIKALKTDFSLSKEGLTKLSEKYDDWENEQEVFDNDDYDDPWSDYGNSYEKYGGYNGYSDDVIDDVFEGDPSATWNVD
jgi:hypothetical protein